MARTKKSVGVKEGDIPVSVGTTVHPSSSGSTVVVPWTPSSHNDPTVTLEATPSAPFIVSPTTSVQAPRVTVHSVARLTNSSRSLRTNSVGSGSINSTNNSGGNAAGVHSSTGSGTVGIGVSDTPGGGVPIGTGSLGTSSVASGLAVGNTIATGLADMLAMGLRPAAVNPVPWSTGQVSYLKCCVVKDSETWAIVFRIEGYSWVERVFFNALRENASWLRNWTFERNNEIFWYQNNESQRNPRNFKIRLFVLRVEAKPTQATLVNVGNFLCRGLTNTPSNTNALEMVGTNYIWIRNPVWSDILGDNQALTYMVNGRPSFYQGYFEENRNRISLFFRPGTLSRAVASALFAPVEEIRVEDRDIVVSMPHNMSHTGSGTLPVNTSTAPAITENAGNILESDEDEVESELQGIF